MKKILFSFSLLLICFSYINVSAIDACTTSEMTRLRELANNVKFNYNYKIEYESEEDEELWMAYSFEILNYNDDLKIYLNDQSNLIDVNTFQNQEFSRGENITFYIYSYTDNLCTDELLRTIDVKLPVYNTYYYFNKERCEGYPDFEYCKEFMDVSEYSFSEIDEMFQKYVDGDNIIDLITDDNYRLYFIFGGIGLILVIIIVCFIFIKRKRKKDDI